MYVESGLSDRRMLLAKVARQLPVEGRAVRLPPDTHGWWDRGQIVRAESIVCMEAVRAATQLLAGPLPTFVSLRGPPGAGKTTLACGMIAHLLGRAWSASASDADIAVARGIVFVQAYWPAKARAETPLGRGEATVVEECLRSTVLVLDDLGAEGVRSTAVAEILFERHARAKPTILTTKRTADQLATHYRDFDGEGVVRRVLGAGTARVIECKPARG